MTDLVERLRARAMRLATRDFNGDGAALAKEAADLTEVQAATIATLRAEAEKHRNDAYSARGQLSAVAKALAWEPPYQASLAQRAEALIARVDAYEDRVRAAEARIKELEAALRNIAEGNLGEAPWQASYGRVQELARTALRSREGEK